MAFRAASFVHENRSIDCSAQFFSVSVVAWAYFQHLHAITSEGQGGLELDVDFAQRLQFFAPGWECRE